ncbi:MAG: hypothetical protein WCS31_09780 [Verrucomicrobiae bacterium]
MSSASQSDVPCRKAWNLDGLPGAGIIRAGIKDLLARRTTVSSCLAVVALPKLQATAFVPGDFIPHFLQGELTLYRILRNEGGDAYSRYNSLLRELSSFERALSARFRKTENLT